MAFSRKKDVKKSSYYVWFLGAKECEGLRGEELVIPVLRYLLDRENYAEPSKVTLQVSNKGMKIIQNVPRKGCKIAASLTGKTEQIKHLIPHTSITCVIQEEDIVCTILLIYNPITKCPVHVHAYRCDSIETATSLRAQLQILIDRPENQRKFREIEARLAAKGLCVSSPPITLSEISPSSLLSTATTVTTINTTNPTPQQLTNPQGISPPSSGNHLHHHLHHHSKYIGSPLQKKLSSDGRSVRTDSSDQTDDSFPLSNTTSSSGGGVGGHKGNDIGNSNGVGGGGGNKSPPIDCIVADSKVAILYESLAAELKAKLGNPKTGPILLPPRDYDTISRKQGKLTGIEARKSTNSQIVGPIVEIYGNSTGGDDTISAMDCLGPSSGHPYKSMSPLKSHKISSHSMSKIAETCCSNSFDDSSGESGGCGGNIPHDCNGNRLKKNFSSSSALASSSSHSSTSISFHTNNNNNSNNHIGNVSSSGNNNAHHHHSSSSSSKLSRPQSSCKSSSGIGSDEAILPPSSSELNLTTHHRYSVNNLLSVTSGCSNSSTSANSGGTNSPPVVKVNHGHHHRNKKHPAPPPPPSAATTTTTTTTSIKDSHYHSNSGGRLSSNINGKLPSSKTIAANKSCAAANSSSGHRSLPLLMNSSSGEDSYVGGDEYQWTRPSMDNNGEPDWPSSATSDDILSSNRPCHVPPPVIPKVRVQSSTSTTNGTGGGGGSRKCSPISPSSSTPSTRFNHHHSCSQTTSTSHTKSSPLNQSKTSSSSTSPSSPSSSSSSFSSSSPFSSPSHSQMAKISGGTRTTTSTGIIKSGDLCKLASTAPKASSPVSGSASAKKSPSSTTTTTAAATSKVTVPSVPVIREPPPKYYFSDPQHGDFMPPARNKMPTSSQNKASSSSEAFKSRSESIHLPSSSSSHNNNNNNNTCCSSSPMAMDCGILQNRLSSYSKMSSTTDANQHGGKSVLNPIKKTEPTPKQSYPVKDHHNFHHHLSSSYHPNSHHLHHSHRSPISY
ncbi:uncharacterized protein LOC141852643 [Brevipalpus obovatus]|uniref:uncharacterized protein LOC141852643 n=1 Tax=Brevipalpus obovatus TaxID=246614 RepID=UPI003D9F6390